MQIESKALKSKLASWFGHEMLPPVLSWIEDEGVPLKMIEVQKRATRARAMGEIDRLVHSYIMMNTQAVLHWVMANDIVAVAWIDPEGTLHDAPDGHAKWITENAQMLTEPVHRVAEPEASALG